MGEMLWQALDITADFEAARQQVGTAVLPILIESSVAAIQRLPWETLYHPTDGFLGKSPAFTLCRQIPGHSFERQPLQPGPLRVLLFTSLPDDLDAEKARLDVEEEQAQVLEALTPLIKKGVVQLEMPDDGRFATLQSLLKERQPHLVFISGHGKFIEAPANPHFLKQISTDMAGPPYAVFQFEDDWGASHFVAEDKIAAAFIGTQVHCVVLSACESGRAVRWPLTMA
jgi:CHAT domain-containing protein